MKRILCSLTLLWLGNMSFVPRAHAGVIGVRFGPPSLGQGGANPLGIPPGPTDVEVSWTTDSQWETAFSISPGLVLSKRQKLGNFYVGLGGGVIIGSNGTGIGPCSSFGWESSGSLLRYGIEYKQALGFTSAGMISPYAVRFGLGVVF